MKKQADKGARAVKDPPSKAVPETKECAPEITPGKSGRTAIPIAVSCCAAALSVACCACLVLAPTSTDAGAGDGNAPAVQQARPHVHDWAIDYEIVSHDAVTHEEIVQPVFETTVTHHSVCNDCSEIVDGHAAEHIEATGHSGYSTNVPVEESCKVSDGRIETVVDSPAYEELVATGRTCTICGERA